MNGWKTTAGWVAGTAVAVAAVAGGWLWLEASRPDAAKPEPTRVVKLVRVGDGGGPGSVTYPGRIQPVRHAELFFRVSGPVIQQQLTYGQTVEAGAVLMRIDPRDYEREVERLDRELEMQQVQRDYAGTEFRRQKQLYESKAASQAAYDSALTKLRTAEVQCRILETSLKIARDKLQDTVLIAPFHGTVTAIDIEQYEIARANVPVVTLQDLRDLEIKVNIPAGNLPKVSVYDGVRRYRDMRFKVTFPGRGDRSFVAAIKEFKPVADATSETYELLLRMEQPADFVVLPGMTAEVHGVPFARAAGAAGGMRLPFSAVFFRNGAPTVWVYDPGTGKLSARAVTLDRPAPGDAAIVTAGLKPGELAVAAGGDWLTAETPVRVLNPEVLHEIR